MVSLAPAKQRGMGRSRGALGNDEPTAVEKAKAAGLSLSTVNALKACIESCVSRREGSCAAASAGGRSHRFLEFEHELVDRLAAWRLDREVARILGVAPEIAFGDEFESRRLDFAAQRAFLDAVEALADRCAGAGFRGMVGDHEHPAGLERR